MATINKTHAGCVTGDMSAIVSTLCKIDTLSLNTTPDLIMCIGVLDAPDWLPTGRTVHTRWDSPNRYAFQTQNHRS